MNCIVGLAPFPSYLEILLRNQSLSACVRHTFSTTSFVCLFVWQPFYVHTFTKTVYNGKHGDWIWFTFVLPSYWFLLNENIPNWKQSEQVTLQSEFRLIFLVQQTNVRLFALEQLRLILSFRSIHLVDCLITWFSFVQKSHQEN